MLTLAFAENAVTTGVEGSAAQPPVFLNFIPMILIFLVFYFLIIKPQKVKQQQHLNMIAAVKKNDGIVTNGGIHGTVINVKDTTIIVKIDDNVKVEIDKSSISRVKK